MATNNNIDGELNQILTGYYGSDIRMAIYEALRKLWKLAKEKEGGSPGPTPTPLPTDQYFMTNLATVISAGDSLTNFEVGELSNLPAPNWYVPLTSEDPPEDWDENYTLYYVKTGISTFATLPETQGGIEYEPNRYYFLDKNYRGDTYLRTLIEEGQVSSTISGRQFYNTCIGDVYVTIATTAGYIGPTFLAKEQADKVYSGAPAYEPGGNTFTPFPYLIDGEQWYITTTNYWQPGASDPGLDFKWLPFDWPNPSTTTKPQLRTILEYLGAISQYELLTDINAPDDWASNYSNYYRYDNDSTSETYQDYIQLESGVPYTSETYFRKV